MDAIRQRFEQAATYTLDTNFKGILHACSLGKYPPQFKVVKGVIQTFKGNKYTVPTDPFELMNLTYDIINGQEVVKRIVNNTASSRAVPGYPDITDDVLYCYAVHQSKMLGKNAEHAAKLYSCIYGALFIGRITMQDIQLRDDIIVSIGKIDPSIPCLLG